MTLRFIADPLLAVVMSLPVYHADRDKGADVFVQRHVIAEAIRLETRNRMERALLITIAKHETNLSLDVHRGFCRPGTCDPDSHGVPRARGIFQTHQNGLPDAEWEALIGLDLDATRAQVRHALDIVRRSYRLCRTMPDPIRATFVAYGTGAGCEGTGRTTEARVEMFWKVWRRLG